MNDGDSLFRAIGAAPAEDTPRLAYADFLQERGDGPRAEFIRAQVRAARLPAEYPDRAALEEKAADLLYLHGRLWQQALPAVPGVGWGETPVRRFYEHVSVRDPAAAEGHRAALPSAQPIRSVSLAARRGWRRSPGCRSWRPWRSWPCTARPGTAGASAPSAASPHAARLQTLSLYTGLAGRTSDPAWGAGLLELLSSPRVPRLAGVEAVGLLLGGPAGRRRHRAGPPLRALVLSDCHFGGDFLTALFALPAAHTPERLSVSGGRPDGDAVAAAVGAATRMGGLRSLRLGLMTLTDAGAAALGAEHLRGLRELELPRGCLSRAAARALRRALPGTDVSLNGSW